MRRIPNTGKRVRTWQRGNSSFRFGIRLKSVAIPERTGDIWHCHVEGVGAGQLYGFRAQGRYAPDEGFRFNAHKLLLDPYGKGLAGRLRWSDALMGY